MWCKNFTMKTCVPNLTLDCDRLHCCIWFHIMIIRLMVVLMLKNPVEFHLSSELEECVQYLVCLFICLLILENDACAPHPPAWRNNIYTFLTCMSFPFVMSQTFSTRKLSTNNSKWLQSKNFLFRRYHFNNTMCAHTWEGKRKKRNKKESKMYSSVTFCLLYLFVIFVFFLFSLAFYHNYLIKNMNWINLSIRHYVTGIF